MDTEKQKIDIGSITIEPFGLHHIEDVSEIHYRIFDGWSMKSLISDIANNMTNSYVAMYYGRALGFCSYLISDDAELVFVCTNPSYYRQGIATKLLETTIKNLPASITSIVLEVRSKNENAIKLYEKLGFKNIGVRKNMYSSPLDDGIVMEYVRGVKKLD